ncbi:hypothetical protein CIG75_17155 [Tumebacillus algifaecis]|uniref:Uncharacterized protein n=1 Tax=Tumebacillus algifaecis TaxID=1214604 RepID=A0A223D574_9BACL|nr:hypothetical protein [Tumebacillus algifaecis]ASS76514.1 hypothetical protein CIG75_17155 [Tumebacillus algifaecis]
MSTLGLQEGWAENRPVHFVSAGLTPLTLAGMYVLIRGYDPRGGPLLAARQKQILDSIPGMSGHSALRLVHFVEVPPDLPLDAVTGVQDVLKRALRVRTPGMVVNAPVVPLEAKSPLYPIVPAWHEGMLTGYLDIGPMPIRTGNAYQCIRGIDKTTGNIVPVPGQKLIFDSLPTNPSYSSVRRLHYVRVPEEVEAHTLRSVEQIMERRLAVRPTTMYLNVPIPETRL